MSNFESKFITYQQFEISTNSTDNCKASDLKLNRERKKLLKNRCQKVVPIIISTMFMFLSIYFLILYILKKRSYSKLESKVMDHIFHPYHSELIPNLQILKKIKKWIRTIIFEKTGKDYQPSLRMCYKATKDGDYAFHEKTDKWEGYILIIKDENNNIFGGYTSKNFKGHLITDDISYGYEKRDITSFLFNLNKNEVYPLIDNNLECNIYGDREDGPIFGSYQNSDLAVSYKFLTVPSHSEFPKNYNLNGETNINKNTLRLTNGQNTFLVKELEVFRVYLVP